MDINASDLPLNIKNEAGETVGQIALGAAEGSQFLTLYLHRGDIVNVRNVQGGTVDTPNLDLGAGSDGSAGPRGNIVLNFDVGNRTLIYDGRKHVTADFANNGKHHLKLPTYFHNGAYVPNGTGGWKKL
jgi:hypothetical protein